MLRTVLVGGDEGEGGSGGHKVLLLSSSLISHCRQRIFGLGVLPRIGGDVMFGPGERATLAKGDNVKDFLSSESKSH